MEFGVQVYLIKLIEIGGNGTKLVNNNPKVLKNTNGCKIMIVHENKNRIHGVFRIENSKMMKQGNFMIEINGH